jgi:hypothetical protein
MKNRKAFNFYKSYYEVVMELETDKDRLDFLMALLNKQFNDIEPKLFGASKFAYVSQRHSINSQVDGYKHKSGYQPPTEGPLIPPSLPPTYVSNTIVMTTEPPSLPPYLQEQEKGEEKEKEKVQEKEQLEIILNKLGIK